MSSSQRSRGIMSTTQQNATLAQLSIVRRSTAISRRITRWPVSNRLIGLIVPTAGLVLWEVLARVGVLPANTLPAPTVIGQTILELGRSGELGKHVGITLWRITTGFLLGAAAGTLLGGLTGYVS